MSIFSALSSSFARLLSTDPTEMLPLQYSFERYGSQKERKQSVIMKARVRDMDDVEAAVFDLTDSLGTHFIQEDVYFAVPNGHLKLRIMHPNRCGHLIYRSSTPSVGPQLSETNITEVEDVFSIRATLAAALGEIGVICKRRRVFINDDVRIYLDDVDNIGQFVDIAVSCDTSEAAVCAKKAEKIREQLRIAEEDVIPAAYLDLMVGGQTLTDREDLASDTSNISNTSLSSGTSADSRGAN